MENEIMALVDEVKLKIDKIAAELIALKAKIPDPEVLENIDKIIEKAEKYDKLAALLK